MPLYRKFFVGPKVLKNMDHFLIEQNRDHVFNQNHQSINLVTYVGPKNDENKYDSDLIFATKTFRKLFQKTPDNIFNLKFWYVEDSSLA